MNRWSWQLHILLHLKLCSTVNRSYSLCLKSALLTCNLRSQELLWPEEDLTVQQAACWHMSELLHSMLCRPEDCKYTSYLMLKYKNLMPDILKIYPGINTLSIPLHNYRSTELWHLSWYHLSAEDLLLLFLMLPMLLLSLQRAWLTWLQGSITICWKLFLFSLNLSFFFFPLLIQQLI